MADNSCDSHTIQVDEPLDTDNSSASSDTASPYNDGAPESVPPQPAADTQIDPSSHPTSPAIAHLVANPSLSLPPMASSNMLGNAGLSSGFALPANNPFTDSNEPVNPFTPSGTPLDTPMATPPPPRITGTSLTEAQSWSREICQGDRRSWPHWIFLRDNAFALTLTDRSHLEKKTFSRCTGRCFVHGQK